VEFWAVATRPLVNNGLGMIAPLIAAEVRGLRNLFRLLEGAPGIADEWERLVTTHGVSGKQAHDAHLVAAMRVHRISRILTFNGKDFERYGVIEIVEPASVAG
jgi:predicted nucleic acid-binding protein